jgi:peptidoglycan hydrolase-like protein with peptidoglycan-binding domain
MTARRATLFAIAALAAGAVTIFTLSATPGSRSSGHNAAGAATAAVIRTTLASREQVPGALEHAGDDTLVFQQPTGTVSWLPQPGAVIGRGGVLYRVDGRPVRLLYGSQAAYRLLAPGLGDGADVHQLQRNLIALGDTAGGLLVADGRFGWTTTVAVEQWQRANRERPTGELPLGSIAFLSGPVLVKSQLIAAGTPPQPGAAVLALSSTGLEVSVPLDPSLRQLVHVGDAVRIQLPEGQTTRGRVAQIGIATAAGGTTSETAASSSGGAQSGGGAPPQPNATPAVTVPVTVALDHPRQARGLDQVPVEVQITDRVHHNVLAVPVQALLALAQGGYAVAVESGSARRLIPVTPGIFDGERVEVTSPRLHAGMRVEVPPT